MGITGLLPLLKSIHRQCNLKKFSGLTIGVDAYGWLHRGTVACAVDLALGRPTTKFVEFAMHRVRMLIHFGVTPYIVFDGDYLPSKAATEDERSKRREESKRLGLQLHHAGKASQAHLELQKAVDVTPEMARQLIDELKRHKVQYVVAPYEADAQLAYLEQKNIIQGIISEDSDLLVFGARRLLTKLDQYGECVEINRDDFTACKEISLAGWTDAEFRRMAILSGCDYLDNISKMGLKTAYRLVRKYKSIEKIIQALQFEAKFRVPPGYLEDYRKAELTFIHQRIFCPLQNEVIMAKPLDFPEPEVFDFIGKEVNIEHGRGVSTGDLHPMTKEPLVCISAPLKNSPSPWGASRKQSVSTPLDAKKTKPIQSFFKPKRTPLAELDPNSFTPSPSQRQLQEQHAGTWLSSPVVASPLVTPSNISVLGPSNGRSRAQRPALASSTSCPPPKRQRLCNDDEDTLDASAGAAYTQSRFFNSAAPDPSPSFRRSLKTKRNVADVQIFSDDSIEEAMSSLPDISGTPSQRTSKVPVFCDDGASAGPDTQASNKCDESQTSVTTVDASAPGSRETQNDTPASSISTSQKPALLVRSNTTSSSLKAAVGNYSHQSKDGKRLLSTTPSRIPLPKAVSGSARLTKPPLPRSPSLSSLQRERIASLQRTQSANDGPTITKWNLQPSKQQRSTEITTAVPESPERTEKPCAVGSEDFLIPNSEDENDLLSEGEATSTSELKASLGRFLYSRSS